MGPLLRCFLLKCLLIIFLVFPDCFLIQSVSFSPPPPCWDSERSALLQLKESFLLNKSASSYEWAYPKVRSWKVEVQDGVDCCSWDGIECDDNTGHVVGLDLSSSFLYGSIDSNSSLFHLVHLTRLNLSDNDFNGSKIPSAIGNLNRLSLLDLSSSVFFAQIPAEVLELSKLEALDLSDNSLELRNPSLKSLTAELFNLEYLNLDGVNVSSVIPQSLTNLSSLTYLSLASSDLHGELPKSIGNLKSLSHLDVSDCKFSGPIPSSLANLTQLTYLSLSFNGFSHGTLSWVGKLSKLTTLNMSYTNSYDIPSSLQNLTQLTFLSLRGNHISSQIPYWFGNITQLTDLVLGRNELWGLIPQSIFTLVNLEFLHLAFNHLIGTYKFESFSNLKHLRNLILSGNNLSLLTTNVTNVTVPKYTVLVLSSCNLLKFPDFLSSQDELEALDLSLNNIHGLIPKWIWGLSALTLVALDLSKNLLTGFEEPPTLHTWTNLKFLDLGHNKLQGFLPIFQYSVLRNSSMEEVLPSVCNLTTLIYLDVSNNNFSGMIPPCLGNPGNSLSVLHLQSNNFHGPIPQTCRNGSKLKVIDFSQNQLDGQIPRSMVYCNMLESLNLGNNQLYDTFPSQFGKLRELKILILAHNRFHGAIAKPETDYVFPKLRILDLSFNQFVGQLPSQYFQRWEAMKVFDSSELRYLGFNTSLSVQKRKWILVTSYSMTLRNKGVETKYQMIQEFLVAIDLSSNQFEGSIPEDLQFLKGLQSLNLSNNFLSGQIPPSLANLINIESLDLSRNKISGGIPQELVQLTFLGFLNVSHNQLKGPIPQGKQFATFDNNSFGGNPGLCGRPLSNKCHSEASPPPSLSLTREAGDTIFEFGWKIVALGYGSGVVVGLILGYTFNPWKHKWFVKYFGDNIQQRRMRQRS